MQLTPRCQRAIDAARDTAIRLNSALTPAHLVYGLLSLNDGGVANNLLKRANLSLQSVEAHLQTHPALQESFAQATLDRADEEARFFNHNYTGTEHLLLSLLTQDHGPAHDLFRAAKIDRQNLTHLILRELGHSPEPAPQKLLLLEDNPERAASFQKVVAEFMPDWTLAHWPDAPTMLAQCDLFFDHVRLISLDHDLNPLPGSQSDPGTGKQITQHLAGHLPFAPVIIHSSNSDAAWSMFNDLRFAGWPVQRVGPIGEDWIQKLWLPKARELIDATSGHVLFRHQSDHLQRASLARQSLEGLAIGDALGEMLSYRHQDARQFLDQDRSLPPPPWRRTDDSEMALSIFEILNLYGYIHPDALARRFAWRFDRDPERGYGKMTRIQLTEVNQGGDWRKLAASAFSGRGSMGNGAAMRAAPLGAFFWDNDDRIIHEATQSALITHTHPEGVAGAIAVAIAAAEAVRLCATPSENPAQQILQAAYDVTPNGLTRETLKLALQIPSSTDIHQVAKLLGNGSLVTAPDTVPYAIWCAAHHLEDYPAGVLTAITGGGDCDTNAAIVGGIIASYLGSDDIPQSWRDSKEPFPFIR